MRDYETPDFDSNLLLNTEIIDSRNKINIFTQINIVTHFFQNYSPFEFPIFCLNFDYMRVLMQIVQEKIKDLNSLCEEVDRILSLYPKEIKHLQSLKILT